MVAWEAAASNVTGVEPLGGLVDSRSVFRPSAKSQAALGRSWAVILMLLMALALGAIVLMTRADKVQRAKLDLTIKRSDALPTPAPKLEDDEEMDPDKPE